MKALRFTLKSVPSIFGLVTVAAYGLLLPFTGFYWDDWPFAWIARFLGPSEFIPAFAGFRPFLGPLFFLTTSLLPPDPLLWQSFALLTRFAAALAAWFAMHQFWPDHKRQTLTVALLFLVYPGYSQHWVAFTHINQEWISLIAYLLSFGFTARAVRAHRGFIVWTSAAVSLQMVGLLPTEYFVGLEPLRFVLIWVIAANPAYAASARLRAALRIWWPYLLVWLANVIWLVYYYRSGVYVSYDLAAVAEVPRISQSLAVLADAFLKAGFYAWVQVLVLAARSLPSPSSIGTAALIATAFALLVAYLPRLDLGRRGFQFGRTGDGAADAGVGIEFGRPAVVLGILGVILGRVPSFAAGLPLTLQSSFDRFMISMMLGASLLVVGLLELLVQSTRARTYMVAGLVALGIGQQFFNSNIFRRDWQRQQEIFWQLAWRIPALPPNTAILTQQMPLDYETDLSMTAAINWIYAAELEPPTLPYAMIYTEKRLGGVVLPALRSNVPIRLPFRTMEFNGSTSQVIVIYVPPNGCLRVFDPALNDMETYSRFPEALTAAIPLSKPSLIRTEAKPLDLPSPPFGRSSVDTWCYFYEKAEMSRHSQDWEDIIRLRTQASVKSLGPQEPFEWLPFIEAEARAGDLYWARQVTLQALDDEPKLQRGLCELWQRVGSGAAEPARVVSSVLHEELGCGQ